jgi:hypothetical protein
MTDDYAALLWGRWRTGPTRALGLLFYVLAKTIPVRPLRRAAKRAAYRGFEERRRQCLGRALERAGPRDVPAG